MHRDLDTKSLQNGGFFRYWHQMITTKIQVETCE